MDRVEAIYPTAAAVEWDNVGLLLGRTSKQVEKVYIALDATKEVISAAIEAEADLLLTHHPLIFTPLKNITDDQFIGERVMKILQQDMVYYAMHTNYDVLRMGGLASELLGLTKECILEETGGEESRQGLGRIGDLSEVMTLEKCCVLVKEQFALDHVKVFGDLEQRVRCAAIMPGSGKGAIEIALQKGADVLITGDIDHHEGIDAVARNMAVIDAGHYGIEHIFVADMQCFFQQNLPDIKVVTAPKEYPFRIV